ncbi:MAG: hypothetical protein Tsb005_04070 [Gammaproteobacteria bacterium]
MTKDHLQFFVKVTALRTVLSTMTISLAKKKNPCHPEPLGEAKRVEGSPGTGCEGNSTSHCIKYDEYINLANYYFYPSY